MPIPQAASQPIEIAECPDRVLFFNESAYGQFGRYSVNTGKFLAPVKPPSGDGFFATSGPDANVWFTEASANKIGVYVRRQMSVSPVQITFTATGQQQTVTVSEEQYSGIFNGSSSNTAVATVGSASSNAFNVTAQGAGTCTVTIADTKGNSVPVSVTVSGARR